MSVVSARRFLTLRAIGLALAMSLAMPLYADPSRLAVSIPPWHSLAAGVTAGITDVTLLLPASHSPHEGGLAPSTLRALLNADLVVWTGPQLETGLARALEQTDARRVMTVADIPAMQALPLRQSGSHDHHDHGGDQAGHDDMPMDPHLWLSPANARAFAVALADRLVLLDVTNADAYRANLDRLLQHIDLSEREIRQDLAALETASFLVFHDAYQYFETAFGVASAGAVTLGPDRRPGARRLRSLRQLIEERDVHCVFTEPQFEPALVRVLTEDLGVAVGVLDPLGTMLEPGPDLWFRLMEGLRDGLLDCLQSGHH